MEGLWVRILSLIDTSKSPLQAFPAIGHMITVFYWELPQFKTRMIIAYNQILISILTPAAWLTVIAIMLTISLWTPPGQVVNGAAIPWIMDRELRRELPMNKYMHITTIEIRKIRTLLFLLFYCQVLFSSYRIQQEQHLLKFSVDQKSGAICWAFCGTYYFIDELCFATAFCGKTEGCYFWFKPPEFLQCEQWQLLFRQFCISRIGELPISKLNSVFAEAFVLKDHIMPWTTEIPGAFLTYWKAGFKHLVAWSVLILLRRHHHS